MAFRLSYDQLKTISDCLASNKDYPFVESLNIFLKDKKDDYYFSGRESIDATSLQIEVFQLGRILGYLDIRENDNSYEILNSVYQSAIGTGQKSVYLYGRIR